jgi:ferredoxin
MMYILEKKNLGQILSTWSAKYEVYAPQKVEGFSQFLPLGDSSDIALNEPHNTRYPPKSLFLPQSEVMLKYNKRLNKFDEIKILPEQRIIFGIRPCDATAITLLDTVFDTKEYRDPYWTAKRENTILVGLGCDEPPSTCFCTTVGYGPFNHDGLDALMTELDDCFVIEALSDKGEKLFSDFPAPTKEQEQSVLRIQSKAKEGMETAFETEGLKQTLDHLFDSDYWSEIAESCLGCGVCTFLCPTCFCFDIVDEAQRNERLRNWDTCMFRIYSQEASGHNPRPTRAERTRQRLMHKYSYWLDHIDKIGCTGCGRCIRYCPVGLDIRAMLTAASNFESEVVNVG